MNQRRRKFDDELWFLLLMLACGITAIVVSVVIAFSVPVVILPAVAESIPTPTRVPLPLTSTPSPTLPPSPTNTREPLTPSPTPATPTLTRTPTEIPLSGIASLAVYTKTQNVWVTNSAGNSVSEVDAKDPNSVLFTLRDISAPGEIAIWQARGLAYVTNPTRNTVTEIDLEARRVSATFVVGVAPTQLTIDQSSGDVYVIAAKGTTLAILFAKTRTVSPITWKAGAVDVAWYGIPGTVIVVNQDGTAQTYSQSGAGDPIKVGAGLVRVAIRPAPASIALLAISPRSNIYITGASIFSGLPRHSVFGLPGGRSYELGSRPRAIANLERCIGVVLPEQNTLAVLDYQLSQVLGRYQVGTQGVDGGDGLAYNPSLDFAYVANHAANSITLIAKPCPLTTPTPTRAPIPFFPTFQMPFFPLAPAPTAIP